ncbi:MAG TPA: 16S rRNA (guanine(527)-N(7))-methyltransferase RsmG [Anaeromyxobacteraceae bacterium]|nr:16S rRNA (guanine(527)-N(7))-methyltransferase RsmG [Anaeromyxobacteraceae bacterium]
MDAAFQETLASGARALGVTLDARQRDLLARYADRLLAWNRKVNLTAITDPAGLAEKHLVDSLALVPEVAGAATLLDVGSGAGLPGIPLAIALPGLAVTCCDTVAKKVAFVKAVSAELDLPVRGVAVRAAGEPEAEGLPRAAVVASRAFADPASWLPLAARYLAPGGTVIATLGQRVDEEALRAAGAAAGLALVGLRRFELPVSRAQRAVASFRAA